MIKWVEINEYMFKTFLSQKSGLKQFLFINLAFILLFKGIVFASSSNLEATGMDTIAGISTTLTSSVYVPNSEIIFEIITPDSKTILLNSKTDTTGVAKLILGETYLKKAGQYSVLARPRDGVSDGKFNYFNVLPGSVSAGKSLIDPKEQIITAKTQSANITVRLLDEYNNPIKDHIVKLFPDSPSVTVSLASNSNKTDQFGQISWIINSDKSDNVNVTVYDATADITISERAKLIFLFENNVLDPSGSSFLFAASGNSTTTADHLIFNNIPDIINVNQNLTFSVSAVDSSGNVVTDYLGTIKFSVVSGNSSFVNLPNDYTFTVQDIGKHVFSLSLLFSQTGNYEIEVKDINNQNIIGRKTFSVVSSSTLPSTDQTTSVINLENPINGTFSNNIHVISGSAPANSKVRITDNDVILATVVTDTAGVFSYTSSAMVDGKHKIIANVLDSSNNIKNSSPEVNIVIDTSSPTIKNTIITPDGDIEPNSVINLKISVSEELSKGVLLFKDNIYEFLPDGNLTYSVNFNSPNEIGEYSFEYVLVDLLGNESRFRNDKKLSVINTFSELNTLKIENVRLSTDDKRVILTWDKLTPNEIKIFNYRVYYGLKPDELKYAVDTMTDSNTWYVPNLVNGVEYYFRVGFLDLNGNLGKNLSDIVKAVPNPNLVVMPEPEVILGTEGEEQLKEIKKDVSDSGPDVIVLYGIFAVSISSYFVYRKSKYRL